VAGIPHTNGANGEGRDEDRMVEMTHGNVNGSYARNKNLSAPFCIPPSRRGSTDVNRSNTNNTCSQL
jgi:hypothetical protein